MSGQPWRRVTRPAGVLRRPTIPANGTGVALGPCLPEPDLGRSSSKGTAELSHAGGAIDESDDERVRYEARHWIRTRRAERSYGGARCPNDRGSDCEAPFRRLPLGRGRIDPRFPCLEG